VECVPQAGNPWCRRKPPNLIIVDEKRELSEAAAFGHVKVSVSALVDDEMFDLLLRRFRQRPDLNRIGAVSRLKNNPFKVWHSKFITRAIFGSLIKI
jgi:hypothetical protein